MPVSFFSEFDNKYEAIKNSDKTGLKSIYMHQNFLWYCVNNPGCLPEVAPYMYVCNYLKPKLIAVFVKSFESFFLIIYQHLICYGHKHLSIIFSVCM